MAGNPSGPPAFDIQKLFKQPSPNPGSGGGMPPPYGRGHSALSYPPPTPLFNSPQPYPFLPYPHDHNPNPNPNPSPRPGSPNLGAHLMSLITPLESATSMPPPSSMPPLSQMPSSSSLPELPLLTNQPPPPMFNPAPSAPALQARLPSSKMPRGRRLPGGDRVVFDVDNRLRGEPQPPQLEVTPITKYTSDPSLLLGRQIAVNRTYICYGLKPGTIRVLNVTNGLRALMKGHTQRTSDMVFFAEDVHILASASAEGRIFVLKIDEGLDEENKPQITGKVVLAIQIVGGAKSYHPRVCWHPHKQEVLIVGIGNYVLKIDTTIVGRGQEFSAENPLICPIDNLIDGVQIVGKHEGEVTDLSMSQWMTTRLVSASNDGTVKIWEDRNATPLATWKPHDGQPVNSVEFLISPQRPDHIILLTGGPLNREVKIWVSASEEGWLLPTDSGSWKCTQTLDFRSSSEPHFEAAFFNQVVVISRASYILLANAKKSTIYAVHVDFGQSPAATRMDYVADFTVTMPILSLTGTVDCSVGEHAIEVFCLQTHAIQKYTLDLFQCLPPPVGNVEEQDSCISHVFGASGSHGISLPESYLAPNSLPIGAANHPVPVSISENASSGRYPAFSGSLETIGAHKFTTSSVEAKPSAPPLKVTDANNSHITSSSAPFNLDLPGRLAGLKSSACSFDSDKHALEYSSVIGSTPTVLSVENKLGEEESNVVTNDISKPPKSSVMFMPTGKATHLITPSEILSGSISNSESSLVTHAHRSEEVMLQDLTANSNPVSAELEVKVVNERASTRHEEFESRKEVQVVAENEGSFSSKSLNSRLEMEKECSALETESCSLEKAHPVSNVATADTLYQVPDTTEELQDATKDMPNKTTVLSASSAISAPLAENRDKQIANLFEGSDTPTSSSPFNSVDSGNVPDSNFPSTDAASAQLLVMQEKLNQILVTQEEMQKQMSASIAVPMNKEGRRMEAALGRSMEKAIKVNVDSLWSRLQEENAKREKIERDHMQQITSLITNFVNKDFPSLLERVIKKEMSAVGQIIARSANPMIEKSIYSVITDSFQRGVGDKAVNQLEKSVSSKLETTVARQIQSQFQTSGKQALQEGLRSSLESSAIPAFEKACKVMFEQVNAAFQKGMVEHTTAALQQVDSTNTPLAIALREALNSASSLTRNATNELLDGQRKLLALVTENTKALNPMSMQTNSGPLLALPELLVDQMDPKKELTRLTSERKFEEAFTLALQRSDVSIVSWLCTQVDLHGICSMAPLPLSQGVMLSLLQQLACDVSSDTSRKVGWMRDVAVAINPTDPMITPHVRPIFEQVYNRLLHQRSIPSTTGSDATGIHITMHVINSLLMSCK